MSGLKVWKYTGNVESTKAIIVDVLDSTLQELLPFGKATECNKQIANCGGYFDLESQAVNRDPDGRIRDVKVGECTLTRKPCLRAAKELRIVIDIDRRLGQKL